MIRKEINKGLFNNKIEMIILLILMLILPFTFFFLLNNVTGSGFGFSEILFSIAIAVVSTLFLLWLKIFMFNRPYLGLLIGVLAIVSVIYGLFLRFEGPYTTTFSIISSLVVLVYLGIYFFHYKKQN